MKSIGILLSLLFATAAFGLSDSEKATIDQHLQGKRIVFLGEPDHWISEKTSHQIEVLSYLISKGFNLIGDERGNVDSEYIQKYIENGDRRHLSQCGECGFYPPHWPNRTVKGTLGIKDEFRDQYLSRMKKNDLRLFSFLRRERANSTIRYFGFDVDKVPDIIFDKIQPYVDRLKKSVHSNFALKLLRSPTGNFKEEMQRLTIAKKEIDQLNLGNVLGPSNLIKFRELVFQLQESVEFAAVAYDSPSDESLINAYTKREKTMFRIVDKYLADPTAKVVLLGHNAHLSLNHNEYRRIDNLEGKEVEVTDWLTVGSYLTQKYQGQTLAIWMLYDHGSHSAPFCTDSFPCKVETDSNTIEGWLSNHGRKRIYESTELVQKIPFKKLIWRENGINRITGSLPSVVDLIFFYNSASGL